MPPTAFFPNPMFAPRVELRSADNVNAEVHVPVEEDVPPECCVCMGCLVDEQRNARYVGSCGHEFHFSCVTKLCAHWGSWECPLCRCQWDDNPLATFGTPNDASALLLGELAIGLPTHATGAFRTHCKLYTAAILTYVLVTWLTTFVSSDARLCAVSGACVIWVYGSLSVILHAQFEKNRACVCAWLCFSAGGMVAVLGLAASVDAALAVYI
jgi:hypothetical protein